MLGDKAGYKSGQGRGGGGLPTFPTVQVTTVGRGRGDWHPPHAGQRGERGAYSCHTDSHGALPWHYKQPGDPFVPYFPPTDSSSGGSSRAPSLGLKGLGMQGMRKAGSKELHQHPAARHQLEPVKRCARKSGSLWCQTALKRSQGRMHPQMVFSPMGFFHNPIQTTHTPLDLTSRGTHPSLCPKTAWGA